MKIEFGIILSGIMMVFCGFLLFYSIENSSNLDDISRYTKHAGIFVGLIGIGVTIAGVLLQLMGQEQPPIEENIDN
jgi:hypothetical protein